MRSRRWPPPLPRLLWVASSLAERGPSITSPDQLCTEGAIPKCFRSSLSVARSRRRCSRWVLAARGPPLSSWQKKSAGRRGKSHTSSLHPAGGQLARPPMDSKCLLCLKKRAKFLLKTKEEGGHDTFKNWNHSRIKSHTDGDAPERVRATAASSASRTCSSLGAVRFRTVRNWEWGPPRVA